MIIRTSDTCPDVHVHAEGLCFVINIQPPMTGQDKRRVFRGYRGKAATFGYILSVYLLSVIRTPRRGWRVDGGVAFEAKEVNEIVFSDIDVTFFFVV